MTPNLPPIFEDIISAHFPVMKGLRRSSALPCDNCGPALCDHYPCENVEDPCVPDPGFGDPRDMRLEALP